MDSCKNDYNMAAQDKTETENLIREKRASLPTLKKEMEKWEKKHNWHLNFKNKKDDLKQKKVSCYLKNQMMDNGLLNFPNI